MNELKRILAAVGFGVCFLPLWLALLWLALGPAAIFWFMCSWMLIAFIGCVVGLIVSPDVDPVT
jgi:hypothetical protein